MFRTDDPLADFHRQDAEQQRWLERLPVCCECDNPIQDEEYFEINDECICPGCMRENHRKLVADYVE
jgi:hypothetical protein